MIWRIYRYYNPIEDKSYIGQTTKNVNDRAKNGKCYHKGTPFRESIDKYGWSTFEQSILRLCTSQEEADDYERYFIEKYNSVYPNGYNLQSGGCLHNNVHKETKKKMSDSHKGKNTWSKGTHLPEETKQKISNSKKGTHLPEETKQKMSDSHKGKNTWSRGQKFFNNGIKNVRAYECPEGFVPGRLLD